MSRNISLYQNKLRDKLSAFGLPSTKSTLSRLVQDKLIDRPQVYQAPLKADGFRTRGKVSLYKNTAPYEIAAAFYLRRITQATLEDIQAARAIVFKFLDYPSGSVNEFCDWLQQSVLTWSDRDQYAVAYYFFFTLTAGTLEGPMGGNWNMVKFHLNHDELFSLDRQALLELKKRSVTTLAIPTQGDIHSVITGTKTWILESPKLLDSFSEEDWLAWAELYAILPKNTWLIDCIQQQLHKQSASIDLQRSTISQTLLLFMVSAIK